MAASNTRFTQNSLGQSKTPIDSDHGTYRYCEARGRFKMKLPRRNFLHLAAGAARCRPSHASLGRKPIRHGRCAGKRRPSRPRAPARRRALACGPRDAQLDFLLLHWILHRSHHKYLRCWRLNRTASGREWKQDPGQRSRQRTNRQREAEAH